MESNLEGKTEQPPILVENYPLAQEIVAQAREGRPTKFEYERTYLPSRLLNKAELMELSGGQYREIDEQIYVPMTDAQGNKYTFRLRRSENGEGKMLHIVFKRRIRDNRLGDSKASEEYQRDIPFYDLSGAEPDAKMSERRRDFGLIAQQKDKSIPPVSKVRYYIPGKLPNGHAYEIHYDIHRGGALDGFVRIEIEFDDEEDERLIGGNDLFPLPDFIERRFDMTNDKRYGTKQLARNGPPPEEAQRQKELFDALPKIEK